jgi:hypothetical protein
MAGRPERGEQACQLHGYQGRPRSADGRMTHNTHIADTGNAKAKTDGTWAVFAAATPSTSAVARDDPLTPDAMSGLNPLRAAQSGDLPFTGPPHQTPLSAGASTNSPPNARACHGARLRFHQRGARAARAAPANDREMPANVVQASQPSRGQRYPRWLATDQTRPGRRAPVRGRRRGGTNNGMPKTVTTSTRMVTGSGRNIN